MLEFPKVSVEDSPEDVECEPCIPGFWCQGGLAGVEAILPCPAGTISNKRTASSEGDCDEVSCPGGFYCGSGTTSQTEADTVTADERKDMLEYNFNVTTPQPCGNTSVCCSLHLCTRQLLPQPLRRSGNRSKHGCMHPLNKENSHCRYCLLSMQWAWATNALLN